jgi:hypothetical protein
MAIPSISNPKRKHPMTKPLPAGTCNTPLNMPREERALWGRAAFRNDTSLNQFFQELALEKLKEVQPALAAEIARLRQARGMVIRLAKEAGRAAIALALIGFILVEGSDIRRGNRSLRVRKGREDAIRFEEVIG